MDIAVPLFFLCTGYLLQEKILLCKPGEVNEVLKASLIKSMKAYLLWSVIYVPLAIIGYIIAGDSFKHSLFDYVRNFLFRGEHYNSWPLWYLLAVIYAFLYLIAIKIFICRNDVRNEVNKGMCIFTYSVFIIAAFAASIGITYLSNNYEQIEKSFFYLAAVLKISFGNGRVFSGCYFVLIGMVIYVIHNNKVLPAVAFIIAGVVLRILSILPCSADVGIACMSVGVFLLFLKIKLREKKIYLTLRNMSKWMYYLHMYVFSVISWLVYRKMKYGVGMFLAVLAVTVGVGILIEKIKKGVKK